ncbi:hypothetical protein CLM62_12775 [Streptomyces sp. SA15]|uniref:hypothetical protein n=1 Tax=Streptomyces sp. SA15 TaxID=934019 RepID=UPI000BB0B6F9|nr:hypothetical protein [Streptomyces sp. SA15]PAZ15664.1 hypothetical protein CLM62_12775 [Streptomyces sp. SA15]
MRTRTALPAVLLALAAFTAGCSGGDDGAFADEPACKKALATQLEDAIAKGDDAPEGKQPITCVGISTKKLEQITGELMTEQLGKSIESALPSPTEATEPAGLTDECRAWIESELLDASESIDATPGYNACGHMSDAELDAAIDTVTDELIDQGATPAS